MDLNSQQGRAQEAGGKKLAQKKKSGFGAAAGKRSCGVPHRLLSAEKKGDR